MTKAIHRLAASMPTPGPASSCSRRSGLGRILRSAMQTRRGKIGAALALLVLGLAFLGPLVPHPSPIAYEALSFSMHGQDGAGLLGTDALGRSVLGRLVTGGWRLLLYAILATALAVTAGAAIGVTAAYKRGLVDSVLMRCIDISLAMPQLVFVLLMLSVIGPKPWLLILCVGVSQAPATARVLHAAAQDVCERDFVKAVAVWGAPARAVIARHVMPGLVTPIMVEAGLRLSGSIILMSGLSFLGLGTAPPNPDWGVMVNENRLGLQANPWGVLAPAILLAALAVGVNMVADAIARANLGEDRGEQAMIAASTGQAAA